MKDRAYAKVNLALDVFNIRADGYHDLKSIMVPISFYDELEINISDNDSFSCNRTYLRFDENNSICKMIKLFKEKYNINDHYEVKLNKQIPTQAGLGGGTSDGASTLRILQRLYHTHLSDDDIRELCVKVGADVYFNYFNKPAIVEGIGDKVKTFVIKKQYYVLLVKPRSGVSTKQAYEELNMDICDHPNIDELEKALENGEDIYGLLGNSLEQPALLINHDIFEIKETLIKLGACNVLMSGSGSTVFAISENEAEISDINDKLPKGKYFTRYTKIL